MINCSKFVADKTGVVLFVRKNDQISCSETWENAYRLIFQTKATIEYIDLDNEYSTTRIDAKADAANFTITIFAPAECANDCKLLEITYTIANGISFREIPSQLSEEKADKFEVGDGLQMDGDVLNVKYNSPELILTMEVQETADWVELTLDNNGLPFSLKSSTVSLTFPETFTQKQLYVGVDRYKWVTFCSSSRIKKYVRVDIKPEGDGRWIGYTNAGDSTLEDGNVVYSVITNTTGSKFIQKIVIYKVGGVEAGTIIDIYGVRADA